jgi:CHAT domain-containing protein
MTPELEAARAEAERHDVLGRSSGGGPEAWAKLAEGIRAAYGELDPRLHVARARRARALLLFSPFAFDQARPAAAEAAAGLLAAAEALPGGLAGGLGQALSVEIASARATEGWGAAVNGQRMEAIAILADALAELQGGTAEDASGPHVLALRIRLANALVLFGRDGSGPGIASYEEARGILERSVLDSASIYGPASGETTSVRKDLAAVLTGLGETGRARCLYAEALAGLEDPAGHGEPERVAFALAAAEFHLEAGEPKAAAEALLMLLAYELALDEADTELGGNAGGEDAATGSGTKGSAATGSDTKGSATKEGGRKGYRSDAFERILLMHSAFGPYSGEYGALLVQALRLWDGVARPFDPDVLEARDKTARALYFEGHYEPAVEAARRTADALRSTPVPNRPDLGERALLQLADFLVEGPYDKVATIWTRCPAEKDTSEDAERRRDEGFGLYAEALERRLRAFGSMSEEVKELSQLVDLARICRETPRGSLEVSRRMLDVRERVLGRGHPDYLEARRALAEEADRAGGSGLVTAVLRDRRGEGTGGGTAAGETCGAEGCGSADSPASSDPEELPASEALLDGDFAGAAAMYRELLEGRRAISGPESPETGSAALGLARSLRAMGDFRGALEAAEAAVSAFEGSASGASAGSGEKRRGSPDALAARGVQARILFDAGEYAKALSVAREALHPSGASVRRTPAALEAEISLAGVLDVLGANADAMETLSGAWTEAVALQGAESRPALAAREAMAEVQIGAGNFVEARRVLLEAVRTRRLVSGERSADTAAVLVSLGRVNARMGDWAASETFFREALDIMGATIGAGHPSALEGRRMLAETLSAQGRTEEARGELLAALSGMQSALGANHPRTAQAAADLGELCFGAGDLPSAVFFLKVAVNADQENRQGLRTIDRILQDSYLVSVRRHYELLVKALVDSGRTPEAQEVLGLLKGSESLVVLPDLDYQSPRGGTPKGGAQGLPEGGPQALSAGRTDGWPEGSGTDAGTSQGSVAEENLAGAAIGTGTGTDTGIGAGSGTGVGATWQGSLFEGVGEEEAGRVFQEAGRTQAALGLERAALAARKRAGGLDETETARLAEIDRAMEKAMEELAKFCDSLSARLSEQDRGKIRAVKFLESRQGTLEAMGEGTVLVYVFSCEDTLYLFVTTAHSVSVTESPVSRVDLAARVGKFAALLSDPALDPRPAGRSLWDALVAPLEAELAGARASTVMFSLDGPLRYVPVAALWDGKNWLAERYATALFTEASVDKLRERPSGIPRAVALGVTKAVGGFSKLPGVHMEISAVVSTSAGPADTAGPGVLPGEVLLDSEFTAEAFAESVSSGAGVVHVASHFTFDSVDTWESFLLLGDGSRLSLRDIRLKRAYDFRNLDLLSLSACSTASGVSGGTGTEVESFADTVQGKGAGAVLASLWPVNDDSTASLMREFYRLRYAVGMDKARALRGAQLSLLQGTLTAEASGSSGRGSPLRASANRGPAPAGAVRWEGDGYSHPFYWAPFIVMGNWK